MPALVTVAVEINSAAGPVAAVAMAVLSIYVTLKIRHWLARVF